MVVVVPAILEEWFFRGYLFGALRRRFSTAWVIVLTTAAFALAHFVFRPETEGARLLPSALMGLALGGVRAASGVRHRSNRSGICGALR